MNEAMRESISALMDGESNELELERILSRVGTDPELRQTWMRYAIAQQAVQGHDVAHPQWDISAQVQRALQGEDATAPASVRATFKQRFLRPLTSFAVAASVALTVVIGGQQLAQLGSTTPYEQADRSVATSASPVGWVNSLGATTVQASYGTQAVPMLQPVTLTAYQDLALRRQRQYMQEHAEQAALNSPQGLVPFARVHEIRK
jgi:sigma-E factor negative regulatory protein RseA